MSTGWIYHERYMWHDTGAAGGMMPPGRWLQPDRHLEHADTKRRLQNLLDVSGLLDELERIVPGPATEEQLLRLHAPEYVARIRDLSTAGGGDAGDAETRVGPGSFEIACLAAGGVIAAVDAVLGGRIENAYALVRPPGHHALADRPMGFCLFAKVAVAALHARAAHGLERIAVVDWDVHHGNGTEAAFREDRAVLTISLHQDGLFPPGSGPLEERGAGPGEGFNLNVPLPPGSGIGAYVGAFERVVMPALSAFAPDLVLIASGYDASAFDPLGRMMLSSDEYRTMTRAVMNVANATCHGRVVVAHEGGYSPFYVPFCGLAVVETLAGRRTEVVDPYAEGIAATAGQQLTAEQDEAIARAEALLH